jgi:hypothetical protein
VLWWWTDWLNSHPKTTNPPSTKLPLAQQPTPTSHPHRQHAPPRCRCCGSLIQHKNQKSKTKLNQIQNEVPLYTDALIQSRNKKQKNKHQKAVSNKTRKSKTKQTKKQPNKKTNL